MQVATIPFETFLFLFEPTDDQRTLYKFLQSNLWAGSVVYGFENIISKLYILLHVLLKQKKVLCIDFWSQCWL